MKRAEALQSLSRDHHRALQTALRLRRATSEDAPMARQGFLEFWRDEGAFHFRVEEDVLLPMIAHRVAPADPAVVRVLTDHVGIRRMASDLEASEAVDPDALNALGAMLDDHVRHEERVLFPMIEEGLSDEELAELAVRVEEAERPG